MKSIILKLNNKEKLSFDEIQAIVGKIANNEVTDAQIGAFLVAITQKGVDKDEFFAFASAMRTFSSRIILDKYTVDSCGTGADFSKTINISTASSIVANACGVNVLKQTNSSITSACGSTDFLRAIGIDVVSTVEAAKLNFEKNSIAFVHSPYFNDFAKVNNPIRQQIGIKTIFNYLGPIINPAFPDAQLLGVSSFEMCEKMAYALKKLGTDRALVVNGLNPNLDEISICSKTVVYELKNGEISKYEVAPDDFGFKTASLSEIQGGSALENANIIKEIFAGNINDSRLDIICMNSGAMLYLSGLSRDMFEGAKMAKDAISSGLVQDTLHNLVSEKSSVS